MVGIVFDVHLQSSLTNFAGMSTIRAYADAARFTQSMFNAINTNIRTFHLLWQANRVLASYCEIASSLVTIFACLFVLLNDNLDAGAAGLSLSYALTFQDFVLWIIRKCLGRRG